MQHSPSPLIQVIVAAYNVEAYLSETLDSLIAQTESRWQCLCLNDGSSDRTWDILQEYAARDSRFKIFSQKNKGVTAATNFLLDQLGGAEFYFMLDADDMIHPSTFEICLATVEKYQVDLLDFPHQRVDAHTKYGDLSTDLPPIRASLIEDMSCFLDRNSVIDQWISKWNKLYRWDTFKDIRFDEQLTNEDDFWYETLIHQRATRKVQLNVPLYYYRINPTSITNKLNFEKYVKSGARRINLSYDYFIKGNRLADTQRAAYFRDLTQDAYRMVVQKNMKKNKNAAQRRELFFYASTQVQQWYECGLFDLSSLSLLKRLALRSCAAGREKLTWLLVKLSAM